MTPDSASPSLWQRLTSGTPDSIRPWLRWHPRELDECVRARGEHLPAPLEPGEADEVMDAHRRWGADPASLANLRRLCDAKARVVVAGQQPGLLGGPLYTLYKALGAVKLAAELATRHEGLAFVPVFWVASEDHDYDEVARVRWPLPGGDIADFKFEHPDWRPGRMVGTLPMEPILEAVLRAVREGTNETEFREAELARLKAEAEGANWEDAFCRLLLRLTAGTGLVIVSPLMTWVRRRGAGIVRRELERPGRSTAVILERSAELAGAGIDAPLHRTPDAVNVFAVDGAQCRAALRCEGERIGAAAGSNGGGGGGASADAARRGEEWAGEAEARPEGFSFNAVTRPMVQDSILPTVAQLVGPGEAAYLGQVEAACEAFGVFRPVRYPRPQVLLLPPNVDRTLRKYDLRVEDVAGGDLKALVQSIQARAGAQEMSDRVAELRARHRGELDTLRKSLPPGTGAEAAAEKLIQAVEKGFEAITQKFWDDQRRQSPQVEGAIQKVLGQISPLGRPQERVFNPVAPFSIQYGPAWIGELSVAISVAPDAGMQTFRLGK